MDDKEFGKKLKAVDALSFKWDHEYSLAFEKIFTENEKQLDDSQKKRLGWDVLLFRLRTINQLDEPTKPRFVPMVEYTNGTVFPNPDEFGEDAITYFRARVSEIDNAVMKARYLDFIWEKGGKENKYEVGRQLVSAYIDAFNAYSFDNEIERIDSLYRAIFIATRLEKKKAGVLTSAAISELIKYLQLLQRAENYRWMLDAIEIVIKQIDKFENAQLKEYAQYIEDGIDHYRDKDYNFTILEAFYKLKFNFMNLVNPDTYPATALADDIAHTYVKEAENRTDSTFVQQHFYGEAAEVYRKAGMTKKSDEMVQKVKDIGQAEDFDQQFKVFSHDIRIPNEELDKLRAVLGSGKRVPLAMGLSGNFVPSWDYAVKLAADLDGKFIAHKIFSTTNIGERGYPIGNSSSDPDSWVKQQYQTEASLKHALLAGFLGEKIENKEVHFSDFDSLFKKIKDIDAPTYDTVRHGLMRFFKKDYLSANIILTTQFEDLLRCLMPLFGLNSTMLHPTQSNAYSEKTLNRILEDAKPMLGENTYRLFEYVLIDRTMHHLRHKDAHGFIKLKDDNYHYCVLILQLYCHLLASLRREEKVVDAP